MKAFHLCIFLWLLVVFCGNAQDTLVLQPGPEGKDSFIWSNNPYTNFGDSYKFGCMAWTHGGTPGTQRSIIDFDLSVIPPGAEIMEARLDLYYNCTEPTYVPHSGENESYLQLITSPWEEYGSTWNNQPSTTIIDQVYLPRSTSPEQDYTDIDVTRLIQEMYNEPEDFHGLMLRLKDENPYNCLLFASGDWTEKEKRPRLTIIYQLCEPPQPSFEYLKLGQMVSFTGLCATAESWLWDFGDGFLSVLQNPVHYYQEKGMYEVCLQVEDSCGSARHCEMVNVCDMPSAGFDFQAEGLTVYFEDTCQHTLSYFWSFGDGYYSDLPGPWHSFDSAGTYTVCLVAGNECGTDTACHEIFVDYSMLTDHRFGEIRLYPTPASVWLMLDIGQPAGGGKALSVSIDIHDMCGRVHSRLEKAASFPCRLDVSSLPPGVYVLKVSDNEGNSMVRKFARIPD